MFLYVFTIALIVGIGAVEHIVSYTSATISLGVLHVQAKVGSVVMLIDKLNGAIPIVALSAVT
jgi:hypothetical protein